MVHSASGNRLARSSLLAICVRLIVVSVISAVVLLNPVAHRIVVGQSLSEPEATAAYLLNFARFTEWPLSEESPSGPLTICATDRDVAESLAATVNGRTAGARAVATRRVNLEGPHDGCHVLYATGLNRPAAARLTRALINAPVLTVSDESGFVAAGGDIELFIEDGRMGFLIHRRSAERSGLRLSSRLLGLARLWKE